MTTRKIRHSRSLVKSTHGTRKKNYEELKLKISEHIKYLYAQNNAYIITH